MPLTSVNPATGEVLATYEGLSAAALDLRLEAAARAWRSWRRTTPSERASLLARVAVGLRERVDEWALVMTDEMGKALREARAEVLKSAWVCEFYAEHAERLLAPRPVQTSDDVAFVRHDPLGPLLGVMPWNFPFWQVFRFAAPALAAGNVVLMKHASNVPGCAMAIERAFREAGAPDGAFTTLLIDGPTAERVVADPRVACVTLTGSEAAGRRVGAAAGGSLKKSVLELGGSDPFVVLADADVERAARVAADARCLNAGQSCIAAKRFVVVQDVHDAFVARFAEALAAKKVGNPRDETTDLGPLARPDLRHELHAQVEASVRAGATSVLGGEIPPGRGSFYPVTLLTGVDRTHAAAREETFGPVAAVLQVADEAEALRVANDTPFGLGASLWTRDLDRAARLAPLIDAGAVFVNGLVKSDPRLPFGGIKASGYGRELADEGLYEFTNVKTVVMTRQ